MNMNTPKSPAKWVLALGLAAFLATMGCKGGPNEEQLRVLDETRQAARSAEQAVADCNGEKSSMQTQLNAKKNELQSAKDELAAVKRRLGM